MTRDLRLFFLVRPDAEEEELEEEVEGVQGHRQTHDLSCSARPPNADHEERRAKMSSRCFKFHAGPTRR